MLHRRRVRVSSQENRRIRRWDLLGGAGAAAGAVLRTGGAAEDTGAVDALPWGFCTRVVGVASVADCP